MRTDIASKAVLGLVGAALLGTAMVATGRETLAADLYVPPPAPPAPPSPPVEVAYDWSGVYLGGHAGWGWMDSKQRDSLLGTYKLDGDNFAGGILGGVNFQSGNIVYGLEGDVAWGNLRNAREPVCDAPCSYTSTFDLDPVGTIRARMGYAMDRTLLFVTAGLGIASGDVSMRGGPNGGKDDHIHLGFVGGAGLEYAATDNILLRFEYLYGNYGSKTYELPEGHIKADFETNTVRAAVSFKLDPFLF